METRNIRDLVSIIKQIRSDHRYIYIAGNGGSSALSAHFACDLIKVLGIKAYDLSSNTAVITAYANDNDFESVFVEQLKVLAVPGDLVILFSTTGNSPNVVKAAEWAKERGIETIAFLGFDGGQLAGLVNYYFILQGKDMRLIENQQLWLAHKIIELAQ